MTTALRTEHGFDVRMPSASVRFENSCTFKVGTKRESHVVSVTSESEDGHKRKLDIYISRAGRLRVFDMTQPELVREMAVIDEGFDWGHCFNKPVKKKRRAK